jgi:hypothetical protein
MNSKEFQRLAMKTEYIPKRLPMSAVSIKSALTMAVACADVMDQIKKIMIYGKKLDVEALNKSVVRMHNAANYLEDSLPRISIGVASDKVNIRLLHASIGMFTESGEMLEAILKQMNGEMLDMVNFAEELGDSDWYKAIAHDELGINEELVRETVIKKLATRYPDAFTSEAALNRDLAAERQVLEAGMK